jgi:hypothetical protein
MVFNIVADMFAILIERAKSDGQIEGWFHILLMVDYGSFNTLTI